MIRGVRERMLLKPYRVCIGKGVFVDVWANQNEYSVVFWVLGGVYGLSALPTDVSVLGSVLTTFIPVVYQKANIEYVVLKPV